MIKIRTILATLIIGIGSILNTEANDCTVSFMVIPCNQSDEVPTPIVQKLSTKISRIMAQSESASATYDYSQFFITGMFEHSYKDIISGAPTKYILNTTLTLVIGDGVGQKVLSTVSIDLKGAGTSLEKAYTMALQNLDLTNTKFKMFVEDGKDKIIKYYDTNYKSILMKAKSASKSRNFEEALMYTSSIPYCSIGYDEAYHLTLSIYQDYVDYEGQKLLTMANGEWAASPDVEGANRANEYISQIDPSASCYSKAISLQKKIASTCKENWDFEIKQKYRDKVETTRQRIAAAKAIGVAYGNHQQPTYNYNWLHLKHR